MEKWVPVVGYEGKYEVSDLGRIRSIHYGRCKILKSFVSRFKCNYSMTVLCKNGKPKAFKTHRLVLLSFTKNEKNLPTINHINGIKTDNRLVNLEWASHSRNNKHAYEIGLRQPPYYGSNRMVVRSSDGKIYRSMNQAAKENGMSLCRLSKMCYGQFKRLINQNSMFTFLEKESIGL